MSAKAHPKQKSVEFRPDSYEVTLTAKERQALHVMLLCGRETLEEIQEKAIPWRSEEKKGQKPEIGTLWRIQHRLLLERSVWKVSGSCKKLEIYKELLTPMAKATHQEQLLDWIMTLIGQEVIDLTLERLNPTARTAAAKLLLKRADQRRVDRRLEMLEGELKGGVTDKTKAGLTPDEKQARIRQILGTE